jgi:deaminated glutathione amidase
VKVGVVQMNSQRDKVENLAQAERLITTLIARDEPDLIALPEYFASIGGDRDFIRSTGEAFPEGPGYRLIARLAREFETTIHCGSMVEKAADGYYNTSVVFGPDGREIARYRKMHLFDIDSPDGTAYRESETIRRGSDIVTFKVGDVTIGCAICYDIRFPELFRALRDRGADVILVPAAFALMTGKDHWEVLVRARAIETQTYVVAPGQTLSHDDGKFWCWGHSMIVDPWGHVVARCSDGVGTTCATLDLDLVAGARARIPVAAHHVLQGVS